LPRKISASDVRIYWRSRLFERLQRPEVLEGIMVKPNSRLDFIECERSRFWQLPNLSGPLQAGLAELEHHWRNYIVSAFSPGFAERYCASYFDLLDRALSENCLDLVTKLAAFENFFLASEDRCFSTIALTTNFRNPLYILLEREGFRRHRRQDSRLLPLITTSYRDSPSLYYCLTKDSLIKHSDRNLLIYLDAKSENRSRGFDFLHALEGVLFSHGGQYLEERAERISSKVILPLLSSFFESGRHPRRPVKILDVGSADGHLLSLIIDKVSAVIGPHLKFHPVLLDGASLDPKTHFKTPARISRLAHLEFVKADFRKFLDPSAPPSSAYDFIFLFKVLHNLSSFHIAPDRPASDSAYNLPEVSNYYKAQAMANNIGSLGATGPDQSYQPRRVTNPASLETASGASLFDICQRLASWTLIEDHDLNPSCVLAHLRSVRPRPEFRVYDLSKHLGLRTNYFYGICSPAVRQPPEGKLLWPT
jgi:hypothetical protein